MNTYSLVTTPAEWRCGRCSRTRAEHTCVQGFMRTRYPFVAMMRVKNERRWIAHVLESIRPLCQKVFLMDDHSDDDTVQIAKRFEPMVQVLQSPFSKFNESRDKNWLYDQLMAECEPEWILCIDGDEALEERGPDIIRDTVYGGTRQSYAMKIEFMWGDREHVRADRIYGDFWRPSLFRPFIPDPDKPDDLKLLQEFRFMATPFGRHVDGDEPNLHCSSVPQRLIHGRGACPVRLKHYGYMDRADRVRKLDLYTFKDWKNEAEGWYIHMTQGDSPLLAEMPLTAGLLQRGVLTHADVDKLLHSPADARLVHAGPIQVVEWDESKPLVMSDWARQQHA